MTYEDCREVQCLFCAARLYGINLERQSRAVLSLREKWDCWRGDEDSARLNLLGYSKDVSVSSLKYWLDDTLSTPTSTCRRALASLAGVGNRVDDCWRQTRIQLLSFDSPA